MLRRHCHDHSVLFAAVLAIIAASAVAQTCDTLLGGTNCRAPGAAGGLPPGALDLPRATGVTNQGLGLDLSRGGDQPGYFAGITFSGGGVKCSGLFRSRDCFSR